MNAFPEDESAWLIEMDGPLYWSGSDGCRAWWSVADAVRFCRWTDADRVRRLMGFETAKVREHVWPRVVMPAAEVEAPPAPAQAGWTSEQLREARQMRVDLDTLFFLGPKDDEITLKWCAAIARVAPHFAKVRVKLPESSTNSFDGAMLYREDVCAALRAAGVEIEGEQ